jgi:hypothetical protein
MFLSDLQLRRFEIYKNIQSLSHMPHFQDIHFFHVQVYTGLQILITSGNDLGMTDGHIQAYICEVLTMNLVVCF